MRKKESKIKYLEVPLIDIEPSKLDDSNKRLSFIKIVKEKHMDKYMIRISGGNDIIIEPESVMLLSYVMDECSRNGVISNIELAEGNSLRKGLNKDNKMYG